MMLNKILRLLLAALLVWAVPDRSQAETEFLGSFGEWRAFQYDSDCWVQTKPVSLNAENMKSAMVSDDFDLMIALKFGGDIPNLQIWLNEAFDTGLLAYALTSSRKYELFYYNEALWLDSDDELPVIKQLLSGDDLKLGVLILGSDEITAFYSSNGLRDAYNHLARNCETD